MTPLSAPPTSATLRVTYRGCGCVAHGPCRPGCPEAVRCRFPGCPKPPHRRGLCRTCGARLYKGDGLESRYALPRFTTRARGPRGPYNVTARLCTVPGCGGKHFARGLCNPHWYRLIKVPGLVGISDAALERDLDDDALPRFGGPEPAERASARTRNPWADEEFRPAIRGSARAQARARIEGVMAWVDGRAGA